jgi:hypothetical protein
MPVYMTVNDLGRPKPLSFRAIAYSCQLSADVRRLEAYWGNPKGRGRIRRDDWLRAWRNIQALAHRLHESVGPQGRCDPETFHHLLLAVGNFKRQAGDIHLPIEFASQEMAPQSEWLELPGGFGRLVRGDVDSWRRLTQIPGLGIPTASCLLAALWPDDHAIMDVLDRRAAVALQVGRHSHNDQRLDTTCLPSNEWQFYEWFRETVTLTAQAAGGKPVMVERALYVVGARTAAELGEKWERSGTWSDYFRAAVGQADGMPQL